MHELSIAYHLIEIASKVASAAGIQHVETVHLHLGILAGVEKDALLFGFEIAAKGTVIEGASLIIEDVPVVIYCAACGASTELTHVSAFRCQECGALSGDIRQGKELELVSLEATIDEIG